MGCCSPEYRKIVNEKEKEINQKGHDSPPLLIKIIMFLIVATGLALLFFK